MVFHKEEFWATSNGIKVIVLAHFKMERLPESWRADCEALIFAAERPITAAHMADVLSRHHQMEITEADVDEGMHQLIDEWSARGGGLQLRSVAGGFAFFSHPDQHTLLLLDVAERNRKKLSAAALETLSIIAYKQPVSRPELESIRGVNCEYALQRLLEKGLIEITGRSLSPGRPIQYGTSDFFLEYLGVNSLADLPKLSDLTAVDDEPNDEKYTSNTNMEQADIVVDPPRQNEI
ncbi:MAG: SMC-Scp complex subunit ScpB [Sphingomonadales bacterium]|nr:SMC-Scp complex subunit ScpB [Sphingomonadales bacterium]